MAQGGELAEARSNSGGRAKSTTPRGDAEPARSFFPLPHLHRPPRSMALPHTPSLFSPLEPLVGDSRAHASDSWRPGRAEPHFLASQCPHTRATLSLRTCCVVGMGGPAHAGSVAATCGPVFLHTQHLFSARRWADRAAVTSPRRDGNEKFDSNASLIIV